MDFFTPEEQMLLNKGAIDIQSLSIEERQRYIDLKGRFVNQVYNTLPDGIVKSIKECISEYYSTPGELRAFLDGVIFLRDKAESNFGTPWAVPLNQIYIPLYIVCKQLLSDYCLENVTSLEKLLNLNMEGKSNEN